MAFTQNVLISKSLRASIICLLALLNACSFMQTGSELDTKTYDWSKTEKQLQDLINWSLFGKLGLRTENESVTAAINQWQQNDDQFEIDISSTFFGLGSSKLFGNSGFLSIIQSGEEPISSFEPDELIASALGLPLPLSFLSHWVKGIPAPNSPYQRTFNIQGLPESMTQDSWTLSFSHYHTKHTVPLPGKIKIQRDNIRIILAVKEWTLP